MVDTVYLDPSSIYDPISPTYVTYSTSAYATKGNLFTMTESRMLLSVIPNVSNTSSQAVLALVYEVASGSTTGELASVLWQSIPRTITTSGPQRYGLDTPVKLEAGKTYGFVAVRTDGDGVSPLGITFPSALPVTDPTGVYTYAGCVRYATSLPTVGDATLYNTTSSAGVAIETVSASLLGVLGSSSGTPLEAEHVARKYVPSPIPIIEGREREHLQRELLSISQSIASMQRAIVELQNHLAPA